MYLIFPKQIWLQDPFFKWTEAEIDAADEKGFIGNKWSVDCYVAKHVQSVAMAAHMTLKRNSLENLVREPIYKKFLKP